MTIVCSFVPLSVSYWPTLSICWNSEYIKEVVCFTCRQFILVYHLLLTPFDSVFWFIMKYSFYWVFFPSTIMGLFFIPESLPASSEALRMLSVLFYLLKKKYLFSFVCAGSCWAQAFSICASGGCTVATCTCHCKGFPCCGTWALGHSDLMQLWA